VETLAAGPAVLAFDVGGTTVKAEVLGPELEVWATGSTGTPRGPAVVDAVAFLAGELLAELSEVQLSKVGAVGLALPGIVDTASGTSVYAANLGLRDEPLADPVSRRLGLPVRLCHDVTAAAEAERRSGAARAVVDPLVVVIGTGIAAVSYVHGQRVAGSSGQAGELGHVVVRPGGPVCGCGARGCLEAVSSAAAVARTYRARTGREVSGAHEVVALLGQDPHADEVWAEATSALADGLLMATALLAPGAIVLGGGLAQAGPALVDPVTGLMKQRATAITVPPLLLAAHGTRAGVVGAGLVARDAAGHAVASAEGSA
jgi:glucokinase